MICDSIGALNVGTPPDRIAAEQAQLEGLKKQRAEVEGRAARTVLPMPFDGNLLSLHLKQRLNSMLEKGTPSRQWKASAA